MSDGGLDIYANFEPARRIQTPVPEKVSFFCSRELPQFARTLAFERFRERKEQEAFDRFREPVSPLMLKRCKSQASFRKMLIFPDITANEVADDCNAHQVSGIWRASSY